MSTRAHSLDAFRGYAIISMILAGAIAPSVMPGWMYHAQSGPRSGFVFDPSAYGITWVDLVFPFFLFAMGASFPFSIGNKIDKGEKNMRLVIDCLIRGFRLTFFAIFLQHMYPWAGCNLDTPYSWYVAIAGFGLLFPMYLHVNNRISEKAKAVIEFGGYATGIALMLYIAYLKDEHFNLYHSNIIILVLANMAIFGSIIYIFTRHNRWMRIGILPFVMAIFLGSEIGNSWNAAVMNFTPIPWMYRFFYLKYLFIVIPGTIAGELLKEWITANPSDLKVKCSARIQVFALSIAIIIWNLYGLYTRILVTNLIGNIALLTGLYWRIRTLKAPIQTYWHKLYIIGAYLLMLGLFFEAYQGGIRKDDSTYSYYFVTSGLAFMAFIAFSIICNVKPLKNIVKPLENVGKNPMIAYVSPQLLIMPLLNIIGFTAYLNMLNQNAWTGLLRGIIITLLSATIAAYCSHKKWFWKT